MEFLWGKWLGFMEAIAEFLLVADKRFVDWMIFPSFINLLGCFFVTKRSFTVGLQRNGVLSLPAREDGFHLKKISVGAVAGKRLSCPVVQSSRLAPSCKSISI